MENAWRLDLSRLDCISMEDDTTVLEILVGSILWKGAYCLGSFGWWAVRVWGEWDWGWLLTFWLLIFQGQLPSSPFGLVKRISRRFRASSFHPPSPPRCRRSCRWIVPSWWSHLSPGEVVGPRVPPRFLPQFIKHLLCRWPRHSHSDVWLVLTGQGHHGLAVVRLHRPLNAEAGSSERRDRDKGRNGCAEHWALEKQEKKQGTQTGRGDSVNAGMRSQCTLSQI